MKETTLKIGDIILVHGFIMLKGLKDNCKYTVVQEDDISWTFKKGKSLVRHRKSDVYGSIGCFERGDNNGIEILK
jgi:hypothetical protein